MHLTLADPSVEGCPDLTLNSDFRKHVFCFIASHNSLPHDDRFETTSGQNQERDDKHCGTLC